MDSESEDGLTRLVQVLEGDAGRDGLSAQGDLGERVGRFILRARDVEELAALEGPDNFWRRKR